ncbi:hypothetical protein V1517DRAFT_320103 [Lipomyces orientalis]|uniref:Uncharacterized protein n=1 Tax=Lipomyces orientalis TaxID=1233043 RepID=A0ACC3TR98_9ASCO
MDDISVSPSKHRQRTARIDYHLLNDGSNEEALPEDRIVKKKIRYTAPRSVELLTPDDSASQLVEYVKGARVEAMNEKGLARLWMINSQSMSSLKRLTINLYT